MKRLLTLTVLLISLNQITYAGTERVLPVDYHKRDINSVVNSLFSPQLLVQVLIDAGIQHPDIVLAQIELETGHFSSRIFRYNHNLFGMKLPTKRETTATGQRFKHASYSNWFQSVLDFAMWQRYWLKGKQVTRSQYYSLLKRIYAEDRQYLIKVQKRLKHVHAIFPGLV